VLGFIFLASPVKLPGDDEGGGRPRRARRDARPAVTRPLTVMTRNLYAGASYRPVLRASPADVPARAAEQVLAVGILGVS
jgi:hypothetical protein